MFKLYYDVLYEHVFAAKQICRNAAQSALRKQFNYRLKGESMN